LSKQICWQSVQFVPTMAPAMTKCQPVFNFNDIANPADILIGYHMGCPDGVASAYILKAALDKAGFRYVIVPIGHSGQKFTNYVRPGQTVFSLDISPSLEDLEALQSVQQIIIFDHHACEVETQSKLCEALSGKVINLSDFSGNHCGASLVHRMVMSNDRELHFDADVIQMIHKMDVFQHKMPVHLDAQFLSFKSFLIQDGERNVSFGLVERMFNDKDGSMAIGRELSKPILDCTTRLFESAAVLVETAGFRMVWCNQSADCRPIDFFLYQELIDTMIDGKPTLFLTQDEVPNAKGIFNLGLRRAGSTLDVSKVAAFLKDCKSTPFVSGGGHPFAGGLQSNVLVKTDEVIRLSVEVLTSLHQSPQQ